MSSELDNLISAVEAAAKAGERATARPYEFMNGYTLFGPDYCVAEMSRTDDAEEKPTWEEADNTGEYLAAAANLDLPAIAAALRRARRAEAVIAAAEEAVNDLANDGLDDLDAALNAYRAAAKDAQ